MNELILLRHSLTEGNERRLYYGKTDLPLTPNGIALCEKKRGTLTISPNARFGHSGMLRAQQTLALLFGEVSARVFTGFREMDMGLFEMHSYEEMKDVPEYQHWISNMSDELPIPQGESNAQVRARVCEALNELLSLSGDQWVVVCHGGTVAHIMRLLFPKRSETFYDWIPEPCCGYRVQFENGTAIEVERI
ncbi:MAG: histidine phosphatase family protein [Clostridia bacterium]|nr:histidine phosphatase family protein [Clostridia bacterium]